MTHLSDLELDAHRLGAADPSVAEHLEGCAACRARADALAREAEDFAARFEPAVLATSTLQAVERRRRWRGVVGGFGALAAAAGVLFFVRPDPEAVRAKGAGPAVELFVTEGGAITPVTGPVPADARLAVRVRASGPRSPARRVRLLWSSAPGEWRALYPAAGAPAWTVAGEAFLPREVVLDGALEPERLGFVGCDRGLAHDAARRMLERGAEQGCGVEAVVITKRSPTALPGRGGP